jgi:hypothetical protein
MNRTFSIDHVYRLDINTIAIFGWCIDPLPTALEVRTISGLHSINIVSRFIARPDVAAELGRQERNSIYGFFELMQLPAGEKVQGLLVRGEIFFLEPEELGDIGFDSAVKKLVGSCNYPHTLLPIAGQPLANTLDQAVVTLLCQNKYKQQWQQFKKSSTSMHIGKLNYSANLTILLIPSSNRAIARAQLASLAQEQKLQSGEARLLICNSYLLLGNTSVEERFDWLQVQSSILGLPFELMSSAPPGVDLLEIILSILCQQNSTYFACIGPSILPVSFGWLQYFNDIFNLNKSLVAAGPSLCSNASLQERRFPLKINSMDGKFNVVKSLLSSSFFVRTEEFKWCIEGNSIVKSGACLSFSETELVQYQLAIISAVEMIDFEIIAVDPIQSLQDKWMNRIIAQIENTSRLNCNLSQG